VPGHPMNGLWTTSNYVACTQRRVTYLYRIKAVWSDSGYKREVKRTVIVAAGDHASLTFLGAPDER